MECCDTDIEPGSETARGDNDAKPISGWEWIQLGLSALLAGNAMIVSLSINISSLPSNQRLFIEIALLGSTVIIADLIGRPIFRKAWRAIRQRRIAFEFLFVLGIIGAVGASVTSMVRGQGPVYLEIAPMLFLIYAIGDKIGHYSKQKGIELARSWAPDLPDCRVETDCGHRVWKSIDELAPGTKVYVKPGEQIPVDGIVNKGAGFIREAHITGEFFSDIKERGDSVFAGSTVVDSEMAIEMTSGQGHRLIDRIRQSVSDAWDKPSSWQEYADRIVSYFLPVVILATAATSGYWFVAEGFNAALMNGFSVLLVACPCALGFAIPLSIWLTLGHYASFGLVASGGDIVERLADIDTVVFDKTGTLTDASTQLVELQTFGSRPRKQLLYIASLIEETSDHPVARAFHGYASHSETATETKIALEETQILPGRGIEATIRDDETGQDLAVRIGTPESMDIDIESIGDKGHLDYLETDDGHRKVLIFIDDKLQGIATVSESPRDNTAAMLDRLRSRGIQTHLVTGDIQQRAEKLGFEQTHAEMSPEQKQQFIQTLENETDKRVLFIGDGVNDAAAMAESTGSIAISEGADISKDVADMTWHGFEPARVVELLDRADDAISEIDFNLKYALGYNIVGMSAAAAGLLHPVFAAILMVSSSAMVTWRTALKLG
jgi:heavy metal translocating P-type ATPase